MAEKYAINVLYINKNNDIVTAHNTRQRLLYYEQNISIIY
jgi:hypothetical protein